MQHIDHFRERVDTRHHAVIHLSGDGLAIHDAWHGRECDTFMGLWKKRWWHWGGCRPSELNFYFSSTDAPYVRCYGEAGDQRLPGEIVANTRDSDDVN